MKIAFFEIQRLIGIELSPQSAVTNNAIIMDIPDLLVLAALLLLIAYDVMDYFKLREDLQIYGEAHHHKVKEKYPQNNMNEDLPQARIHDRADVITTTHRYYPNTNNNNNNNTNISSSTNFLLSHFGNKKKQKDRH